MCEIDLLGLQEPALAGLWLPIFPEINLGYLSSFRGAMVTICLPGIDTGLTFPTYCAGWPFNNNNKKKQITLWLGRQLKGYLTAWHT